MQWQDFEVRGLKDCLFCRELAIKLMSGNSLKMCCLRNKVGHPFFNLSMWQGSNQKRTDLCKLSSCSSSDSRLPDVRGLSVLPLSLVHVIPLVHQPACSRLQAPNIVPQSRRDLAMSRLWWLHQLFTKQSLYSYRGAGGLLTRSAVIL